MCHLSPTVHLAWAILSCGLQVILVQHLWRYDRFKCLKWTSGRQPGAFKRVMTYSYCASVPLLLLYSVSMAVFKYKHGYTSIPGHGIVPTPYYLWPQSDREWLTPLYLVFSVVWALELVTHMEELTFWLFLLHQGPAKRNWFSSIEFKTWAITSVLSVCGMPFAAIFSRSDPLKSETYVFLAGSSASTCITAVFFVVLYQFPAFLRRVKTEGAAPVVVLRLVRFHELNVMRVIFRLLFTLPLLCLGIDGVTKHHILNQSALWTDFLAFIAAFGTVISSTLTLFIFFPRSLAEDSHWRPRSTDFQGHNLSNSPGNGQAPPTSKPLESQQAGDPFLGDRDPSPLLSTNKNRYQGAPTTPYYPPTHQFHSMSNSPAVGDWDPHNMEEGVVERKFRDLGEDAAKGWRGLDSAMTLTNDSKHAALELSGQVDHPQYGANRNARDDLHLNVRLMELGQAVDAGLNKPARPPRLHPYIMSFTSPIDLSQEDDQGPRAF